MDCSISHLVMPNPALQVTPSRCAIGARERGRWTAR
jgi:hypothetical protein